MSGDIYEIVGLARDILIIVCLLLITITVCVVGLKAYGVINSVGKYIKRSEEFFSELQKISKSGNIVKAVGNSVLTLVKLFKR